MITARPTITNINRYITSLFCRFTPLPWYSSIAIDVTLSFIHDGKSKVIIGDDMTGKDVVQMCLSVAFTDGYCREVHSSCYNLYNMLKISSLTIIFQSIHPSTFNQSILHRAVIHHVASIL